MNIREQELNEKRSLTLHKLYSAENRINEMNNLRWIFIQNFIEGWYFGSSVSYTTSLALYFHRSRDLQRDVDKYFKG